MSKRSNLFLSFGIVAGVFTTQDYLRRRKRKKRLKAIRKQSVNIDFKG